MAGEPASELFDLATGKWVPTDKVAAELYDPVAGKWSPAGSVAMTVGGIATALPGGRVLVIEANGEVEGNLCVYDPATNKWTAKRTGLGPLGDLTATLLLDGKVLIAGGAVWGGADKPQSSAYLYDPSTGRLSPTGHMTVEREMHTATLLRSGKVLVAGGASLASAELYDPATGRWKRTGDLVEPRSGHTAMLLGDGKVLVIGGRDSSGSPLASVELYDPDTGKWMSPEAWAWHGRTTP